MREVLREVERLTAEGRFRAAGQLLEESLAADEAREPALLQALGRVYLLEHRRDDAVRALQQAESLKRRHRITKIYVGDEEVSDHDLAYIRGLESLGFAAPVDNAPRGDVANGADFVDEAPPLSTAQQATVVRLAPVASAGPPEVAVEPVLDPEVELELERERLESQDGEADVAEIDEPFVAEPVEPTPVVSEIDPYLVDVDEIVECPAAREEPLPAGVTKEERARQIAVAFLNETDWDRDAMPLLKRFFETYGWSAARTALTREYDKGLSPDELELAMHLRAYWAESDQFWTCFHPIYEARASYAAISWPMALLVCRSFCGLPSVEELEWFLDDEFETWYGNDALRRHFKAFSLYLYFRVSNSAGLVGTEWPNGFADPHADQCDDASDLGLTDIVGSERRDLLVRLGIGLYQTAEHCVCTAPRRSLRELLEGLAVEPDQETENEVLWRREEDE